MKMKTTIRNVQTMDVPGRMAVRDVLLSPPTPREFATWAASMARAADLGVVWDGAFEPVLDALAPADRDLMFSRLDAYREMRPAIDVENLFSDRFKGKPASTDTNPDEERFMGRTVKDTAGITADINARNKAFWDKRLGR
jgi:hypothetical protein